MSQKTYLLIALGAIFIIGAGIIIYQGRPVMKLGQNNQIAESKDQVPLLNDNVSQIDPSTSSGQAVESEDESENETEDDPSTSSGQAVNAIVSTQTQVTTQASTNSFTMAEVAKHNTEADCWSAINGSVYDLSTWVSRHPGGSNPIIKLCGTDGSASFTKKHGGSSKAQSALVLLKIGALK
jgi:cytochrome b involved in lipid metabolism